MNWLQKLQRKYGRYAITGITRYMIFIYIISYVLALLGDRLPVDIIELLYFDPQLILRGQIWRLVSWVLVSYGGSGLLEIIFIIFLYQLGNHLEQFVGSFRMTVYFIGGILISVIGGMIIFLIFRIPLSGLSLYPILFSLYIMLGLFMPDTQLYIYGVLPIRMRWMMAIWAVSFLYNTFSYFRVSPIIGIWASTPQLLALVNVVIFVRACKGSIGLFQSVKHQKRRNEFRASVQRGQADFRKDAEQGQMHQDGGYIHKCAICGRTDASNPELTFRYCSKCTCGQEYCSAHLFTHEHQ